MCEMHVWGPSPYKQLVVCTWLSRSFCKKDKLVYYHLSYKYTAFAWPLYPLQRLSVGNSNGVGFLAGPRGRLATNVAQGIVKGFFRRISLVLDPGSSS